MERVISKDFKDEKVAILTSGGDSQGMNSAICSAGRMSLAMGAQVYVVKWGYQGLVDGGDNIVQRKWWDFSGMRHMGGTVIGSARCKEFTTYEGRNKACLNLVQHGINHLIVIGGDGSLTGADIFRSEWTEHMADLHKNKKITDWQAQKLNHLHIVGMVGSIDNDFCGTSRTIGTDSALHRINECIDSLIITAASHKRAFVVEVMGRDSGFLALTSGVSVGADYIFIPELPPDDDWRENLCDCVRQMRGNGKLYTIVLVAEGAKDINGVKISSENVKDVLEKCVNLDVRITVLGHIQRGGSPSAYDRILAIRQGIEAAINVLTSKPELPSYVICTHGEKIQRREMSECITKCNAIKSAYKKNDFASIPSLRGRSFIRHLALFSNLRGLFEYSSEQSLQTYTFAVVHSGSPAAGMDPCSRAFTIWCLSQGHSVIGFKNGFSGVVSEDYIPLTYDVVGSWFKNGGSSLGAFHYCIDGRIEKIGSVIKKLKISGFLVIGNFDCLLIMKSVQEARKEHSAFRIPFIMAPASSSNNIPTTSFSLGADTTLNVIVQSCDALRLSARSSRKRLFVVETFGKNCGYLSTLSGIASSSINSYNMQHYPSVYDILSDIEKFKKNVSENHVDFGTLIIADRLGMNYDIDTITNLFNEQGKPFFTARKAILGYSQQGASASPYDRFLGAKFGFKSAIRMIDMLNDALDKPETLESPASVCMLCLNNDGYCFTDVSQCLEEADIKLRIPKKMWWAECNEISCILSGSSVEYESVTVPGVRVSIDYNH